MAYLAANILGLTALCFQLWAFGLRPLKELPSYIAIGIFAGAVVTGL